jgi:hypothetical protein
MQQAMENLGIFGSSDQTYFLSLSVQLDEISRQIESMAGQTQQSLLQPAGAVLHEAGSSAWRQGGETLEELMLRQEALMAEAAQWFGDFSRVGQQRTAEVPF